MNITEYINLLEAFRAEHGDLAVMDYGFDATIQTPREPVLRFKRINRKRQSRSETWSQYTDTADQKGEEICLL